MYRKIIRPLLFSLPIERAHRLALVALRIIGLIPGGRWLLDKCFAIRHPALEREVFGLRFPNPVGLAAGFDPNGEAFREFAALGFGFVEIGTVTPRPQAGNPRPRIFRLPKDGAVVNRTGQANRGLERAIQHLRRPHGRTIVGCNIGRNTSTPPENAAADYLKLFRNLYQYVDYFTVNVCCDDAADESAVRTEELLRILEPLFDFRRGQNQYRPVMLKISPDLTDEAVDAITDLLMATPLDGIVAANGTHGRQGLKTSRTAINRIGNGRLGGAPLADRTIAIVRRIHTRSGGTYPIIGVGGMMSPGQVREMLAAGADLVQLYTGFVYDGPRLVRDICRSLIADAEQARTAAHGTTTHEHAAHGTTTHETATEATTEAATETATEAATHEATIREAAASEPAPAPSDTGSATDRAGGSDGEAPADTLPADSALPESDRATPGIQAAPEESADE